MRLKPPSFRVSLFAGILLIMAAAVWMVFKPGDADALTAWKAAQEKQGEVFDLVTLTAAFSAEALAHEARFSNAVKRLVLRPSGPGEFDAMQAAGLGRARVAWQQPWPIEKRREITSWDEVAVQMAEQRKRRRQFQRAAVAVIAVLAVGAAGTMAGFIRGSGSGLVGLATPTSQPRPG